MNDDDKKKISEELQKRINVQGNGIRCPMCGNNKFVLADGFIANINQEAVNGLTIGGKTIPTIPTICTNCGFLAQFSAGVLGLLKGVENEKQTK
jgi:hypothetical protein